MIKTKYQHLTELPCIANGNPGYRCTVVENQCFNVKQAGKAENTVFQIVCVTCARIEPCLLDIHVLLLSLVSVY